MALLDYFSIWFVIDDLYPFSCRSTSLLVVYIESTKNNKVRVMVFNATFNTIPVISWW